MCAVTVPPSERTTAPAAAPAVPAAAAGPAVDAILAAAVELARAAAVEVGGDHVGEHLGVDPERDRLATHKFATTNPAYRGWYWGVVLARAARAKVATVDEVVLLPGPEALLPPVWLPWSERLRPGDLGVGDLLPTAPDDDRLVPAFADPEDVGDDDEQVEQVSWELGLGRPRVLSLIGRNEAAERWYEAEAGPSAPIAQAAPALCGTCGFLVPLRGGLRQAFGVCANEFAPDDGRVVAVDHGCGAHSEAVVETAPAAIPPARKEAALGEFLYEDVEAVDASEVTHSPGSVSDTEPPEPFGHS